MLKAYAPTPWWRHRSNRWRHVLVLLCTEVNGGSVPVTFMQKQSSYSNPPLRKTIKSTKNVILGMCDVIRGHWPQMTFRGQWVVCTVMSDNVLTQTTSKVFIWVRVESNLTHDSWVEHNPAWETLHLMQNCTGNTLVKVSCRYLT